MLTPSILWGNNDQIREGERRLELHIESSRALPELFPPARSEPLGRFALGKKVMITIIPG
jgi:hypothetical protein